MEEKTLIRGLQKGDEQAYRYLVSNFGRKIYRLIVGIVKDSDEAEELTQEVFLKVFQKVKTFREDSAFSTWLFRVAFNTALSHLRRKRNRKDTTSLSHLKDIEARTGYVEESNAEEVMEKKEKKEIVLRALQSLPTSYRIALMLKDIEGLPVEEVAKTLKLSQGGAKAKIHRARLKLRKKIEEIAGEGFFK